MISGGIEREQWHKLVWKENSGVKVVEILQKLDEVLFVSLFD